MNALNQKKISVLAGHSENNLLFVPILEFVCCRNLVLIFDFQFHTKENLRNKGMK